MADPDLTRKDSRALWWAVDWAETVLREWRRDGFIDDQDREKFEAQIARLTDARRALRKVQGAVRAAASRAKGV